ncbi:MAG: 2'-5' RNA ligase family protein [Nitritalea sp.]
MPKTLAKYFLAWIPPDPLYAAAEELKGELERRYALRYAQKSPSHVTLKMPFSLVASKEGLLIRQLEAFFEGQEPIPLHLKGMGQFRGRVIYMRVLPSEALAQLQKACVQHLRRSYGCPEELSDLNFQPHLTVAFGDIKKRDFPEVWAWARTLRPDFRVRLECLHLLKKVDGRWQPLRAFPLMRP